MTKFNNKETYLVYRSEWKANYTQLTKEIRALKAEIRQPNCNITWVDARSLRDYKATATAMIEERKASKVESQRQYLEAKAALVAA